MNGLEQVKSALAAALEKAGIAAQADRTIRVMDGHIVHDSLWDGVLIPEEARLGVRAS